MERFSFVKINALPKGPGVYCFVDAKGKYLYIGKALNIKERVKNHLQNKGFKESQWLNKAEKVGFISTPGEIEALLLEAKLIKELKPAFNVMWRDDKNFFYVMITAEKLPRIYLTHQPLKHSGDGSHLDSGDGSHLDHLDSGNGYLTEKIRNSKLEIRNYCTVGPFVDGRAIKIALRYLRRVFPYYTQKVHPKASCQWCQLGLCPGPDPDPKEYQKNIKKLLQVLQGKKSAAIRTLKKEMEVAAKKQEFEKAAALRDRIFALKRVLENAKIFSRAEKEEKLHPWPGIQKHFRKLFSLSPQTRILRVEAYDISNIQGKMATGSMAVFIKGLPVREQYRHFKIKTKEAPDDFAMMKETVARRLKHPEWAWPDVILVDGGKTQLNAALKELRNFELRCQKLPEG